MVVLPPQRAPLALRRLAMRTRQAPLCGRSMFVGAIFNSDNSDLNGWDVAKVKTMASMFDGVISFNSDLSGWDVSQVTDFQCAH